MKWKLTTIGIMAISISSCDLNSGEESIQLDPAIQTPNYTTGFINQNALRILQKEGEFRWDMVSSAQVSSALTQNDSILTIGYQPEGFSGLSSQIHKTDIHSQEWVDAKQGIISEIRKVLLKLGQTNDFVVMEHEVLPFFKIKAYQVDVIERVRSLKTVRYADPNSFAYEDPTNDPQQRTQSSKGCDASSADNIPSADYSTMAPGSKASWNYYAHNIPAAWAYSTGENITVGVIDTGISPDQSNLNENFASGYSTGRSRAKYGTFVSSGSTPDGPDDQCGHGTQMAGAISGPRTSTGSAIGVAYKANLVSVRGTGDVFINSGNEKDGVTDALVLLGDRNDVKIISMSIGDIFSNGQVSDGIRYAYGKGKMLLCAAGTSFSWTSWWGVVFPANMSETLAITGIKDNGYSSCDICHTGEKVDFVATMQRSNNSDRIALTQSYSGNVPSYVGGSSVATATTAGIAALIWATNPNQTRSQVLDRMKRAADFYPSRDDEFGWGKINVLAAVQ